MDSSTTIAADARRVLIGVNSRAGARDRQEVVQRLRGELEAREFAVAVHTEVDALAAEAASSLAAGELRAVIAAGGDGTLRLIADRTPPGTPLLILPLGTENLLARYFELSADVDRLCEVVQAGTCVLLDAGRAGDQLFTLMAGCGFDADVVRRLHQERRGHIRHLSYARPIFDSIWNYDYPELRVKYAAVGNGGGAHEVELTQEISARWVFVVNLPRYAGGLVFSTQASGTDGLLDVCTFKEGSLLSGLMYLGGVILGQHEAMQDFTRIQTPRLRVESARPVAYQLDGDPGGELPADFCVLPRRLTMLVSREWLAKRASREAVEG